MMDAPGPVDEDQLEELHIACAALRPPESGLTDAARRREKANNVSGSWRASGRSALKFGWGQGRGDSPQTGCGGSHWALPPPGGRKLEAVQRSTANRPMDASLNRAGPSSSATCPDPSLRSFYFGQMSSGDAASLLVPWSTYWRCAPSVEALHDPQWVPSLPEPPPPTPPCKSLSRRTRDASALLRASPSAAGVPRHR